MKKYVIIDGVKREYTIEEYEQERLSIEKIEKENLLIQEKTQFYEFLKQKYKDPYQAIDKLCRHLKIDFETLED